MRRHSFSGGSTSSPASFLIVFFTYAAVASASFISDRALDSGISGLSKGRTLLQAKKSCPISFEFQNYSIITGQCKGPQYPPKLCCKAFLEFACPFADELNDPSNDCATTMFSYINLYGSYPPGLFASECKDSKRGLECASIPAAAVSDRQTVAGSMSSSVAAAPLLAIFSIFVNLMIF